MAHASSLPNPSQANQILAYLQAGNTLTPSEALSRFGCFRLSARIHDLKNAGHNISVTIKKVTTRDGEARVAEYWIETGGSSQ